jgi:hypothetical protein|tara:strand:+ start:14532 stop:14858 length:327 start_codon:yes stop_codon:yes gene_type:complete
VGLSKTLYFHRTTSTNFFKLIRRIVAKKKNKASEDALREALTKLVIICPDKKTYNQMTSLMFQLYCGNDFGLGNFSLSFLEIIEECWRSGRKAAAKAKGIKLVYNKDA